MSATRVGGRIFLMRPSCDLSTLAASHEWLRDDWYFPVGKAVGSYAVGCVATALSSCKNLDLISQIENLVLMLPDSCHC